MIDCITIPAAYLYYWFVKHLERKLGYKVKLNKLSPDWINGTMVFDMTPVWKKHKINAKGVNYYTIGAVSNGISSRFNHQSPYYQSWLGGYIVQFAKNRKWTVQDHFSLGVADQKYWLHLYGDKSQRVEIESSDSKVIKKINLSRYSGTLYEISGWSNSDLGSGNRSKSLILLMSICANIFKISNKSLKLKGNDFIPSWSKNMTVDSYQKIRLKGYVAILDLDRNTKAVLYSNAAIFTDRKGNKFDNFKKIKNVLIENILASEIINLSMIPR